MAKKNSFFCTIEELRGAMGEDYDGPVAKIESLGFRLIQTEPSRIGVVLRQGRKDDVDLLELPSHSEMLNHAFLIDQQALVFFARQVLEHLDPSPELATLQRIECLLEGQKTPASFVE